MQQFENIMVPIDFSSGSKRAFEFARHIFKGDSQIQPAHVVAPLAPHVRDVLFPYAALGEDEVEFEHELIEASRLRVSRHLDINEQGAGAIKAPLITLGSPISVLPKTIAENAVDLVVMSAFGESGPFPDSLGSLTNRVVRSSRAPTLITRDFETHPEVKRIIVATDLTRGSAHVYSAALSLGLATGATVEALFVLPDPLYADTNNILRHVVKFDHKKVLSRSRDRIDALFDRLVEIIGEVPFADKDAIKTLVKRRKVLVGDPVTEILDRSEKIGADLLVVGTQKADRDGRLRLGSVASALIRRAQTHTLVVPVDPTTQIADES